MAYGIEDFHMVLCKEDGRLFIVRPIIDLDGKLEGWEAVDGQVHNVWEDDVLLPFTKDQMINVKELGYVIP